MESSVYNFWPPTGRQCDGSKWYIGTVAAESDLGKIAFNLVVDCDWFCQLSNQDLSLLFGSPNDSLILLWEYIDIQFK